MSECVVRPRPPIAGYLVIACAWAGVVALLVLYRPLPELDALKLLVLALASHQLSRVLTKERIALPVRRLFTEPDGETPRSGWARAPGELVTCPYCASVWSATVLVALQVDVLTYVLAIAGVASVLHVWRDRE